MSKNLKILFFTSVYSNGGGAERVLTILSNNLPKNWCIDILELQAFNTKKEALNENVNVLPYIVWHGYRTKFNTILIHTILHHPEIIKTLRQLNNYDVVVGWMAVEGVSILKAFPESKTIAWFHNNIDYLEKKYLHSNINIDYYRNKRLFCILKNACESADSLVGVSKMCKASILNIYPKQKSKTHIIYNGTDIEELKKMSDENIDDPSLRSFYNKLVQKAPILICVGHISRRKNFTLAVRSLLILKQKNIECNLVILGNSASDGELRELQDEINRCNIQDNVFLLGYQKNIFPFIARSKLLLMTSLDEGFPTVVTEAMALGVPFVTTPVEGASDELSDGERCGLVSDWDAEEYATCIEKLLTDENLYHEMSENCKEHVKKYSVENYVNSLQTLIKTIPEKNKTKYKKRNIIIDTLRLIFYSAFYASYNMPKTYYPANVQFHYLKTNFNFLNFLKFCYRLSVFGINVLCFPLFFAYCSVLVLKYKKRLFAKQ